MNNKIISEATADWKFDWHADRFSQGGSANLIFVSIFAILDYE